MDDLTHNSPAWTSRQSIFFFFFEKNNVYNILTCVERTGWDWRGWRVLLSSESPCLTAASLEK